MDASKKLDRRDAMRFIGLAVFTAGCSSTSIADNGDGGTSAAEDAGAAASDTGTVSATCDSGAASTCDRIPAETSGPYPDTKGMISDAAFNRSDIREDRTGVPLTLTLTIADESNACAPIANANIEIWHCDKDGVYSEYANGMNAGSATTTYLRGVQTTDSSGKVTFQTIYPGWYNPRATHIHVQVYSGTTLKYTTQIGFPDAVNDAVYALSTYKSGQANTTIDDTDQVFGGTASGSGDGDGGGHAFQIASICGDTTNGYAATIQIGITGYA